MSDDICSARNRVDKLIAVNRKGGKKELDILYSSRVRRSTEFAGLSWQRARVAAIASAACTKFNWRLIGRTCDLLLIGTLRRRRRWRGRARSSRGNCGNSGRTLGGEKEDERRKKWYAKRGGRRQDERNKKKKEPDTRFSRGWIKLWNAFCSWLTSFVVFLVEESGWGGI